MAVALDVVNCPLCSTTVPAGAPACPQCGLRADWLDLLQGIDFAQQRFVKWGEDRSLAPGQVQKIQDYYQQERARLVELARGHQEIPASWRLPSTEKCWSCRHSVGTTDEYCVECGAPVRGSALRFMRFAQFLQQEVAKHVEAGRITLAQGHARLAVLKEQADALQHKLEKERIALVEAAEPEKIFEGEAVPPTPSRPFWEAALDPKNLQLLLIIGGGLFVLGLVIWLATLGFFEQALVKAIGAGVGNAVMLAGGCAMIRFTRYQGAGRALTLLACLVMPLNLVLYNATDLIVVAGHLWVPALFMCVFYAGTAWVLRDALFAYVLVGGVTLTGLLILASMNHFGEVAAPATLLVVLGLLAIHVERAFAVSDGPYSRQKFGLAFFWSGHAVLASGLFLILGAQLFGVAHPFLADVLNLAGNPPDIVRDQGLKVLALCLVLAGTYAYLYSDIVVRKIGIYIYIAVFTLLWAEILFVLLFKINVGMELIIIVLALTALGANLLNGMFPDRKEIMARSGPPLGLFLSTVPVLLGLILHIGATNADLPQSWRYQTGWSYVLAMLIAAASCRVGAYLYRNTMTWLSAMYFFGTGACTIVGAAGLLTVTGVPDWHVQAMILILIPIAYIVASRLYEGHTASEPLLWVAHTATAIMVAGVIAASLHITQQVLTAITGEVRNLLLAVFFLEAAFFYVLATTRGQQVVNIFLATAMACLAFAELLYYFDVAQEWYALAFALLGFMLLIGYRMAILEQVSQKMLPEAAFHSANALMSLSFLAAALMTLTRFARNEAHYWWLFALLILLTLISLGAAWLVQQHGWRRWYVTMAIVEGMLSVLVLQFLSALTPWEKLELFSVVLGIVVLGLSHWGWRREDDRQSDLVSLGFVLGCMLVVVPLTISVLIHRLGFKDTFSWHSVIDEVGMLAVGLLLMASGLIFKIKATTVSGSITTAFWLVTLVLYFRMPEKLHTTAVWLIIGGGSVFALGLFLVICRERLLALPEKIKRREGVFRVMGWR